MSGICGWFGRDRVENARGIIEQMTRALPSHGLTQQHFECGDCFGLGLRAHPATSAFAVDPDIVAAIEGYPRWSDPSLRDVAKAYDHARALIAAYRGKGAALLDGLRGDFSFAIVDSGAQRALCAIDRFGIQTLCFAEPHGLLVFGSTTDAVRAHPQVKATISEQSVYDYLYFVDRVPAPMTIYREQRKLAPGEYLLSEPTGTKVRSYWQMPYCSTDRGDYAIAAEELKQRLNDAVNQSLSGEDPCWVGAFLSGGLDSSTVVGLAARLLPQKLQTFTIGFPIRDFDETYYAEIAAKHFETKHTTYYLRPEDVIDILVKSVEIYDEPFANSSLVPAYHCARLAKDAGVGVMLAGDGGDELFAGNKRYMDGGIADSYARLPSLLRRNLIEPMADRLSFARQAWGAGRILRYVQRARQSAPERMMENLFQTVDPDDVLTADLLHEIDTSAPLALATSIYEGAKNGSKVQQMMHLDLRITLADSDLRKVVRMCELAGVRVRFPFLDDDVAEYSARLPESLLLEGGELRGFYKNVMRGFLPEAIITKRKHGFGLPYLAFMNSHAPLKELICDSLTSLKRRKFFKPEFLSDLIDATRQGNLSGYRSAVWDVVVLELWLASRGIARRSPSP